MTDDWQLAHLKGEVAAPRMTLSALARTLANGDVDYFMARRLQPPPIFENQNVTDGFVVATLRLSEQFANDGFRDHIPLDKSAERLRQIANDRLGIGRDDGQV